MKRLLIVDDEEDMVWSLQKNLKNETLELDVITARSGEEALEVLKEIPIDLIITDIKMPGISGLDLLVEVKKRYPQTGVIVMTAYPSPEFKKDAAYKGCLHFVEKPFDINNLREIIQHVIEEDKGFKGTVSGIELTDVIQINCLSKITAALKVKTSDKEGILFFKDGWVVHAAYEKSEGEEAFYKILAFEGGTLESLKGAEPPENTIEQGWEALIMEGLRRIDETKRGGMKEHNEKNTTKNGNKTLTKEEKMGNVNEVLREFTAIDGVNAACLVERDGFVIESITPSGVDTEMVGAIASTGLGSAESMGKQLTKGNLSLNMVEYEGGSILLSPIGEEAFLVIVAEENANLGMIRYATKRHRDKLSLASVL